VHVVRAALRLTGVPSYFSGELVQIPAGVFEIQGGCSGLHYFIVGLAVAVLLGELRRDPWRTRLRWVLVGGALALASNWVRVYTIILAGHLTHMQSYLVSAVPLQLRLVRVHGCAGGVLHVRALSARRRRENRAQPPQGRGRAAVGSWWRWLGVRRDPAALDGIVTARLPDQVDTLIPTPPRAGWQTDGAGIPTGSPSRAAPTRCAAGASRARRTCRRCTPRATSSSGSARRSAAARMLPAGLECARARRITVSAGERGFVAQEYEQRRGTLPAVARLPGRRPLVREAARVRSSGTRCAHC
jgi:exosortase/archaeosortase family protein